MIEKYKFSLIIHHDDHIHKISITPIDLSKKEKKH
jgi:hypothetical protein